MTKPYSPRLLALLQTNANLFVADIYRFTLVDGSDLRYCAGDQDIMVNGLVYSAGGVQIGPYFATQNSSAKMKWSVGTGTDTMTFEVIPGSALVGGAAFLVACKQGVFDGATLKVSRLFMPTYGDTRRGPIVLVVARVAEVDVGRSSVIFTVNTFLELLDQPFPRNLYQPGCVNNLGDTACGVNLGPLAVASIVTAGSTNVLINGNFTASPSGQFDQGKITFTSGALNGFSRTIKTATAGLPGSVSMLFPFPSAPTIGDTFSLFPGCNKSFSDTNGCPKFSNTARWRGTDKIPVGETAI
jgi:uncharacterized phage protein (TIGR02218 family)